VKDRWTQSQKHTGIICEKGSTGGYSLELWRAMGELDGYIEIVEKRRRAIAKLLACLKEFIHEPTGNSFSALLVAMPGSGKSYLVSKLAEALGMPPPLSFNITQLVTRQNINACFDAIASAQAQDRNRTHLVFFDEINAKVETSHVYDLFLTVLEDGTYLRGGQLFKLDPCAWLFASTRELRSEKPGHKEEEEEWYASKEGDFKSRLSIQAVSLNLLGDDNDERRSFVYQAALQLQQQHSDVKKISAKVLKAFYCLDPNTSNRKIKQLAAQVQTIQYGEVRFKNLPKELKDALEAHGASFDADWILLFGVGRHPEKSIDLDNILVEVKRQPEENS
jgi:hypothetical protein